MAMVHVMSSQETPSDVKEARASTCFERVSYRVIESFILPLTEKLRSSHPMTALLLTSVIVELFVALRWLLDIYFGTYAPFYVLLIPVFLAALFLGFSFGLYATMLSIVSGVYFLLEPRLTFQVKDPFEVRRMMLFVVMSLFISVIAGAFRDSERRIRIEKNRADEASRAKSDFLSNLSHEVRTPLAAIVGFAELLDQDRVSEDDKRRFYKIILRNGCQLNNLLNSVLDIAKVEAGRMQVESIPVSVSEICSEVASLMRLRAEQKGVHLLVDEFDPLLSRVVSDPVRLRQIIQNLVSNAVKFTEHGEISISAHIINLNTEGDSLIGITVRDTGVGIPGDKKESIFEPFIQADATTARKFGGTGLGLPLAKKLAQALGGDLVLLDSEAGRGSTFLATFKARLSSEAQALENTSRGAAENESVSHGHLLEGVRILLAEDSPDNQLLITRYLGGEGAKIETAENGYQAVDKAMSHDYDLVLMDIQMPELDGYEATRKLRSGNYRKPILALTAHALSGERERCVLAGCSEYMTKPIDKKGLIAKIKSLIQVPTRA